MQQYNVLLCWTILDYALLNTIKLCYYNDTSSVRLRVSTVSVLNIYFTCCTNQARPPCVLQKSHSDRREVENKLPANEWSLEHCDVDVGTTFILAVQPCTQVLTPRRVQSEDGRTRFSQDSCERRCSTPVCPVTTLTLNEHFYINCLAAVYFAACRFVPTDSTPSSMRVLRNGHKIRPTEYMGTAMIAVQCYGSRLWYCYGCSFSVTLGTLNWQFYGCWQFFFFFWLAEPATIFCVQRCYLMSC